MKQQWLVTGLSLVMWTVGCNEQINIDQNSGSQASVNLLFSAPLGESFTAVTQEIEWIGMFVTGCPSMPIQFQLTLRQGSGVSGSIVASKTATEPANNNAGFIYFDFRGTTLVIGSKYTAMLSQITPSSPSCEGTAVYLTSAKVYAGGTAFLSGKGSADGDFYLRVVTAQ
jgi:hypothetical protein